MEVRRVYIRHDAIGEDDLFVPCKNLVKIIDLKDECVARLHRLGVYLRREGLLLKTKAGDELEDCQILKNVLEDSQIIVAVAGGSPMLAPHIKLQHPALKENIRLYVPLAGLTTMEDVRCHSQTLLQHSDPFASITVPKLCDREGVEYDLAAPWAQVLPNSSCTVFTAGCTEIPRPQATPETEDPSTTSPSNSPTFKSNHKAHRDSALFNRLDIDPRNSTDFVDLRIDSSLFAGRHSTCSIRSRVSGVSNIMGQHEDADSWQPTGGTWSRPQHQGEGVSNGTDQDNVTSTTQHHQQQQQQQQQQQYQQHEHKNNEDWQSLEQLMDEIDKDDLRQEMEKERMNGSLSHRAGNQLAKLASGAKGLTFISVSSFEKLTYFFTNR